ncbi:MAG: O-antigen ligase family protein [Candidatus Marinimicrobia bacterium]|nr:O-antigen ligase family protein [Candidatus Neomarinimicrobiota bacterium]
MNKVLKIIGGNAVGYGLGLTVWLMPLVICNRMMWDFYYPKELFFQIAVAAVLVIQLFRKETIIHLHWMDAIVITGLLLPGWFAIIFLHSPTENLRLPFYTVLFYLLIKSLSFESKKEYFRYFLNIAAGLFLIAVLIAFYGILQYCGQDFLHPHGMVTFGPKVVGTLGHANIMAGYLAMIFPLGLAILKVVREIKWKVLTGIGLFIMVVALIMTESRGAWLALLGSLIIINFQSIKTIWQKIFKNRLTCLIACMDVIAIGLAMIYGLINLNRDSVIGRWFVWRITWNMFVSHPVFGIGFQRFPVEYLNYQADFFDNVQNSAFFSHAANMKQADNEYLQVLAENGLTGALFCIFFLVILWRCWLHLKNKSGNGSSAPSLVKALGVSLSVVCLHSIVDNPLRNIAIQIIFLFFIGMISQGIKITGNPTTTIISFRNRILLRVAAVVFLGFTIFYVFLKGSAYINWRQGQAYFKAGYYEKSIEKYCQAQRKLPDTGELLFHLGSAYAYTNQPEKALLLLRKSKATFNDKNIFINEGLCYYRLRDFENAEKSLSTALRMYPELLLPRLWLAEIYLETDRREEALAKLREIHEIQPKNLSKDAAIIKQDARLLQDNISKNLPEK